jgi:DNA-binding MarR family transcriptional regulator
MDRRNIQRQERLDIWLAFLRVHNRVTTMLEQELEAAESLPMSWFDVLEQLRQEPDRTLRMQDLGDRLAMSASGLSRRVSRMEQSGLVERRPCPEDRRGVLVTLTEEGDQRYRKALPVHLRGVERHFLRHIEDDDIEHLRQTFDRMLDEFGEPTPEAAR